MAYQIYKQKLLYILAEQQEDGSYIIKPYTRNKDGVVNLIDEEVVQTMPKEVFELNYEEVEDG